MREGGDDVAWVGKALTVGRRGFGRCMGQCRRLQILLKHLQGRPGWWGGGVGAVRAVGAVSDRGWRRRRVGGQSADGGGDGQGTGQEHGKASSTGRGGHGRTGQGRARQGRGRGEGLNGVIAVWVGGEAVGAVGVGAEGVWADMEAF